MDLEALHLNRISTGSPPCRWRHQRIGCLHSLILYVVGSKFWELMESIRTKDAKIANTEAGQINLLWIRKFENDWQRFSAAKRRSACSNESSARWRAAGFGSCVGTVASTPSPLTMDFVRLTFASCAAAADVSKDQREAKECRELQRKLREAASGVSHRIGP